MLSEELMPQIRRYIMKARLRDEMGVGGDVQVRFLAQGEYNLNYLVEDGTRRWVLRVNTASQMNLDNQIEYEFKALSLLAGSGVTPRPLYLDASRTQLPFGILAMEYLPGQHLTYSRDLEMAARTFAAIHGCEFTADQVGFLVKEEGPLTAIYEEAYRLLEVYFGCGRAKPRTAGLLEDLLSRAERRRHEEECLRAEPWRRVINTEVNSSNFIVNRGKGTCHLVDWEKPIYGEPAQDLAHFLIPTTTLWKQDYLFSREEEERFLATYLQAIPECPVRESLKDRVELFKFFNILRAVSWCAMAWTEYTGGGRALTNEDTFTKIVMYLEPEFLRKIA